MMRLTVLILLLPTLAVAQIKMPERVGDKDNEAVMNQDPVPYSSPEADFKVIFPTGCGKIVAKVPQEEPVDENGDPLPVSFISYCDRYQEKGEGCSVTTFFNVRGADGPYPGPDQVIERVLRMLDTMGLNVERQQPLRRELEDGTVIEGLDVLAGEAGGAGQAWVRGLLHEGDIFLLTAWKDSGDLANDPDYITFFNSFQPGAE